jgi:DNA polymerase-3 subunit alpha (Gram-positive type)
LLGHDVPTKYKALQNMTGIDVRDLPMNDKKVMELFASTKSIGVEPRDINNNELGTFGLPELGTKFVRQMILEAKPTKFADLLQISGLSHGTGVWLGNAQELVKNGTCTISEVIGTRDNIMVYLIRKGMDSSTAFIITESVRKGKGLTPEWEQIMKEHDVPDWYIDSCKKIKYMFPKAHASAYIIAAMRLGWFKVYEPLAFYASHFSVQPEGMDAELAMSGRDNIRRYIEETEKKGIEATKKEEDVMVAMLLVLEMNARGLRFLPVDIYKSAAFDYRIEDGAIRLPFSSINGVGETAADNIEQVRDESIRESGSIFSVEDICKRAKIGKTLAEILRKNGVFKGVPETDQISLF